MKKLLSISPSASRLRLGALLFSTLALLVAFCCVTMPLAGAREMSPTQMLQESLPHPKTLADCTRSDLLSAVCAAVKKYSAQSSQIVRVAISAHKAPAADVVGEAITCLGKRPDCNLVGQYVSAAIAASSEDTSAVVERALMLAPDCRAAVDQAARGGGTGQGGGGEGEGTTNTGNYANPGPQAPVAPLGFGGGAGGTNPGQSNCNVCSGGASPRTQSIPCSQVSSFLAANPGSYSGACQATPVVNK